MLLDGDVNGRLGDLGLAKLYEYGANSSTTRVVFRVSRTGVDANGQGNDEHRCIHVRSVVVGFGERVEAY